MNYDSALQAVERARTGRAIVDWVSPAVAVCLAAERTRGSPLDVEFTGDADRYAKYIGLIEALDGNDPVHQRGYLHGRTYSPLEWLNTHEHVHRCNATVGELFRRQATEENELRRTLNKIVGELHDNVASHSRGKGFSAAQVYGERIEYAIADAGCGLLRNARRIVPSLQNDLEGIEWAFVRGNTSAPAPRDEFGPQKGIGGPEFGLDAAESDHHAGWGLDELRRMIDRTHGLMWVASGNTGCTYAEGRWQSYTLPVPWSGVFIEFQVPRGG